MSIDNSIYSTLGERWYEADDDPVALLRAEARLKNPWIISEIAKRLGNEPQTILDIGCGAGFLTNDLARAGHKVTGLDLSHESLEVAKNHDHTGSVHYISGDAYRLPFEDKSCDVISAMDFLEHVERPADVVKEVGRALRPGGLFFFHTFNRNFLSWLVIIKAVELLVKNTPKNMHVLPLFIKPNELEAYCESAGLKIESFKGIRPNLFKKSILKGLFTGEVPKDFSFSFTENLLLSYAGVAVKRP